MVINSHVSVSSLITLFVEELKSFWIREFIVKLLKFEMKLYFNNINLICIDYIQFQVLGSHTLKM